MKKLILAISVMSFLLANGSSMAAGDKVGLLVTDL